MPERVLRKFGVSASIDFTLFDPGGDDFRVDATHAAGDTKIRKDGSAEVNTTNAFADEGSSYSLVLTAAELQAKRIFLPVVDQDSTKIWRDSYVMIETYGHSQAMHPFDLGYDLSDYNEIWKFKQIDIENDSGSAFRAHSTNNDSHGIDAAGQRDGAGINAQGGSSGHGLFSIGGNNGHGIYAKSGGTNGHGIRAESVGVGSGSNIGMSIDCDKGNGLDIQAGSDSGSGSGVNITGGLSSGHGISISTVLGAAIDASGGGLYPAVYLKGGYNNAGLSVAGDGTGEGFYAQGGFSGHGILGEGGFSGHGIMAQGTTSGSGIHANGGASGHGISAQGNGSGGDGMNLLGSANGHGLQIAATGSNKNGIHIDSASGAGIEVQTGTNQNAVEIYGNGSGSGIYVESGAGVGHGINIVTGLTGNGVNIAGGTISGAGIRITTTDGYAIDASGGGANAAVLLTGGTGEAGLKLVGTGTVGLDTAEIGTPPTIFDGTASPSIYEMLTAMADASGGSDFTAVSDSLVAISVGVAGISSDVNVISIDGQATNANNATLNLKQLNIVNNAGSAIVAQSTGSDGHGISVQGNGTGHGVSIAGGATGNGINISATDGYAIDASGGGTNAAVLLTGGTGEAGLKLVGTSAVGLDTAEIGTPPTIFDGTVSPSIYEMLTAMSDASGGSDFTAVQDSLAAISVGVGGLSTDVNVVSIDGQLTNGNNATLNLKQLNIVNNAGSAIVASSTGGNGHGIEVSGNVSGHGVNIAGGTTGNGMAIAGGATSGAGINISATSGNAIDASGGGTNAAVLLTGGTGEAGLKLVGTGTVGLDTAEIGTPPTLFDGTASPSIYAMLTAMSDASGGSDFTAVQDSLAAISVGVGGLSTDVNVISIDGELTSGNNATLNLKQLNIVNSAGSAIIASSTGNDGHGIEASGNGTGHGVNIAGGATGNGINISATTGYAIDASGGGTNAAVLLTGGTGEAGLKLVGTGTVGLDTAEIGTPPTIFDGTASPSIYEMLTAMSDASGGSDFTAVQDSLAAISVGVGGLSTDVNVVSIDGELTSGNNATLKLKQLNIVNSAGSAIVASSTGSNGHGIDTSGNGSGSGIYSEGGTIGTGIEVKGGATSGAGINISATDGYAIDASGGGTNAAVLLQGGTGEAGLKLVGTGTVGLDTAEIGTPPTIFDGTASPSIYEMLTAMSDASGGSDFTAVQDSLVAISNQTGGITSDVNIISIDGQLTNGNNATLNLKQLNIVNNAGSAIVASSTGGNGHGMSVSGNGSGHGFYTIGGVTGNGVNMAGGATSGAGVNISATDGYAIDASGGGLFPAVYLKGGYNNAGLSILGDGTGSALYVSGDTSGHGIESRGGDSTGDGFYAYAQAGDGAGMRLRGVGTGRDLDATEVTGGTLNALTLDTLVDGTSLEYAFMLMMSRVNGKYLTNDPSGGFIKFFRRDNVTELTRVYVTPAGRTRVF